MTPFCSQSREAGLKSVIGEPNTTLTLVKERRKLYTMRGACAENARHPEMLSLTAYPCSHLTPSLIQCRKVLQNNYCWLARRMEGGASNSTYNVWISKVKFKVALVRGASGTMRASVGGAVAR
jgi:hypothetical protein